MALAAANNASAAADLLNFCKYSAVYDLLYHDKDYAGEAEYVACTLRAAVPHARDILELGSGTGRHGRLLAAKGFEVHGIERSADMVALANASDVAQQTGTYSCEVGDLRGLALARMFDAVIALFHVVSYQTTNDDLCATFDTAARHLRRGGVFLFDVWHGPAVLAQRPERRVKKSTDEDLEVVRTAQPQLNSEKATVKVRYDIEIRDKHSGELKCFSEDHVMRYLFPAEIESLAAQSNLCVIGSEEFTTGCAPSSATWGVMYVLRKVAAP